MNEKRPKSSLVGMGDLALTVYNTRKLRGITRSVDQLGGNISNEVNRLGKRMKGDVDRLGSNLHSLSIGVNSEFQRQNDQFLESSRAIERIKLETMSGLHSINSDLSRLDSRIYGLERSLGRMEDRQEMAGNLRLSILKIEEEIKKIRNIATTHLEYAALMAENLKLIAVGNDISTYKYLSGEDLRWARDVFELVKELDSDLQKALRE
jgi:hypothetical protein